MNLIPPPFELQVLPDHDRVIVRVEGELDLSTVGRVETQLTDLRTAGWQAIVLDLRPVTFMDSTGLRLLVSTQQFSERDGFDFQIADGSPAVSRVLDLTGMSGVMRRAELQH